MTKRSDLKPEQHTHTAIWPAALLTFLMAFVNLHGASEKWLTEDFPYFSMTLDGRHHDQEKFADAEGNIAVRGLIFPMDHEIYACFDLDLLRWSHSWMSEEDGEGLEMTAMAPLSYENLGRKTPGGQKGLTKSKGRLLSALGIYPGFSDERDTFKDPRPDSNDINEPGSGPIPPEHGQWIETTINGRGATITYKAFGSNIKESPIALRNGWARKIRIDKTEKPLFLAVTQLSEFSDISEIPITLESNRSSIELSLNERNILQVSIPGGLREVEILIKHHGLKPSPGKPVKKQPLGKGLEAADTNMKPDLLGGHYSVEVNAPNNAMGIGVTDIRIPETEDHVRRIRPSGLTFLDSDTLIICTFDGGIWKISGCLNRTNISWEKIGSGLHEPQSIMYHNKSLFSFTRNGLIQMQIDESTGKILRYQNFNNQFAQSTETREFAMDAVVDRHGNFFLAKGGQKGATSGFQNGTVLKVNSKKNPAKVVARGLRQAYLGYNQDQDWVTASDQQGNWIPSTPFHILKEDGFYGFRTNLDRSLELSPIQEPILWMPHRTIQSGAGQIYIPKSAPNPLTGKTIYIDYYASKLALIYLNDEANPTQGAFSEIPVSLSGPILKGIVHPNDGSIWLTGFKIWGSKTKSWGSLIRIKFNNIPPSIPTHARSHRDGLWVEFEKKIESIPPNGLLITKWNYMRTSKYGSGYYKDSGEAGTESFFPDQVLLSGDRKSIFVRSQNLRKSDQIQLDYKLKFEGNQKSQGSVFFTIHAPDYFPLEHLKLTQLEQNFEHGNSVNPTKLESVEDTGKSIYLKMGCQACHSIDGSTAGRSGPTFKGLWNSKRKLKDGKEVIANHQYLKESILEPTAKIIKEFSGSDIGMPSYEGVLNESQIESLIEFIKSLKQ